MGSEMCIRDRAEALLVSADVKVVDKAFVAFRKKNAGELRQAA